jgi:L-lysine 2,3-aminomutase
MAHYSHPRELEPRISDIAIRRIRDTGATIRSQGPLIRRVNDLPDTWATMWQKQVDRGIVPYYMFVERDTGPRRYFDVPLHLAHEIFTRAIRQVSGLGRTVRGPSMSCTPGKVLVDAVVEIGGEKYFALKFLQGRDPEWTNRMFFARYDEGASWIDQLEPAFSDRFFFEEHSREVTRWRHFAVYPGMKTEAQARS